MSFAGLHWPDQSARGSSATALCLIVSESPRLIVLSVSISLQLTRDEITPSLRKLGSDELMARGVMAAGTALMSIATRAFDEPGLRPAPWPARKKAASHPLLRLSGTLWQSWHVRQLGSLAVQIGNPTKYAAHHQFGSAKSSGRGSGVPARPFFPADKSGNLTQAGADAVKDALEAVVDAAK